MLEVRRYIKLYQLFLAQHFKMLSEYRVNFLVGVISTIVLQGAGLLAVWIVMSQLPNLNGWTLNEILLIYGMLLLTKSLGHMFADNLWTIGVYVRNGTFDRFLVRPLNPLFQLLADRFCQDGVGEFLLSIIIIRHAAINLGIHWTLLNTIYFLIAILSGGTIFFALNLITCVSAFWNIDSTITTRAIFEMHIFARYPLTIYPYFIKNILTWIIPYGFVSFYPVEYLLGYDIGLLSWLAPVIAGGLYIVGYLFWKFGLHHYTSTGS